MITPSSKSIQNYNYPQSPLCLKYPSWRHYSPLCISVIFHTKFITRVSSSSKFQLSYVTAHLKSRSQLHARKLHKRVTWQKHQCFSVNFLWKNKWHISELKGSGKGTSEKRRLIIENVKESNTFFVFFSHQIVWWKQTKRAWLNKVANFMAKTLVASRSKCTLQEGRRKNKNFLG